MNNKEINDLKNALSMGMYNDKLKAKALYVIIVSLLKIMGFLWFMVFCIVLYATVGLFNYIDYNYGTESSLFFVVLVFLYIAYHIQKSKGKK